MKKLLFIIPVVLAVVLMGCPGKKRTGTTAIENCGCRNAGDTSSICESFISGRCGFCASQTCDMGGFCSYMPRDVDFKQTSPGYAVFLPACQNSFDWFSWQSFVAINWPADKDGNPLPVGFNSDSSAPRVWESFLTLPEVFDNATHNTNGYMLLGQNTKASPHIFEGNLSDLEPGSSKPLIDRNLNFTLYEVRVNKTHANYIWTNNLTTYCGQKAFYQSGKRSVQFPPGSYSTDSIGAIEIKTGWRVLIPGVDDFSRFFTRKAIIAVPDSFVVSKVAIRDTVTVGLVAMHLVRNVSTDGSSWIWSSFEQIDNAPDCPNGDCGTVNSNYSFYNASCTNCGLNTPPSGGTNGFLWSVAQGPNKQYGRQYANGSYGSQIGRLNVVEKSTDSISTIWRNKLKQTGSVWQYYRLIGSQWLQNEGSRPGQDIGIPTAQANTAAESYLQVVNPSTGSGSCMSCHGFATGRYPNLFANLSFTLFHANPDSNCNDIRIPSKTK